MAGWVSMGRSWSVFLLVSAFLLAPQASPAQESARQELITPAEASDFRATPSYDGTMAFLRRLEAQWPMMKVTSFGRSAAGRDLPLVIVSKDGVFTPGAARASGKPVVLIQSGIHAGEIDGKDASLILLRDLALGRRAELLDAGTLLFIPIYNVDGHERVSKYSRANQNGPVEGMGWRTTADGHDLNRDHLKIETPEARALIGLVSDWPVHLHLDNHVTNGSDHDWVMTWSWAEAPQIASPIDAWIGEHLPKVLATIEDAGHRNGPYVSLINRGDPTKGFSSWVGEPRYSGGYFALRHVPSILVEMHVYKPYERRVKSLVAFLDELISEVARAGDALVAAHEKAASTTIALGRPEADRSDVVLVWEADDNGDTFRWPVYEWTFEPSRAFGVPLLTYERGVFRGGDRAGIEVPWIHRSKVKLAVSRPRGYLIEPGWPEIERRLADHGLTVHRLDAPITLEAETLRLEPPTFAPQSYQGQHQVTTEARRELESVALPEGALFVPADQPLFEVAVQLLEPEAPDSLVAWGYLSTVFERKEYIEPTVLEPIVREMLAADEALAKEWSEALKDEDFAGNFGARWQWWYRKTPYWDDSVGKLPIYRVLTLPEELESR